MDKSKLFVSLFRISLLPGLVLGSFTPVLASYGIQDTSTTDSILSVEDDGIPYEADQPEPEIEPDSGSAGPLAPQLTVGSGCTYATISAAISAASPGNTILIEGGGEFC